MQHDIKQNRPKKSSRTHQGYINPKSCKKLFENQRNQPIIYRSSWEKKFINWCETSSKVKLWGSECLPIKYLSGIDKQIHTYYPDFCLVLNDDTKVVVEIKPHNQTIKPDSQNQWAMREYVKNMSKWSAMSEWCKQRKALFWIITEKTLDRL